MCELRNASALSLGGEGPTTGSTFITWSPGSQCTSPEYDPVGWPWRKACIDALLSISAGTDRWIVLPDDVTSEYDLGKLKAWYSNYININIYIYIAFMLIPTGIMG